MDPPLIPFHSTATVTVGDLLFQCNECIWALQKVIACKLAWEFANNHVAVCKKHLKFAKVSAGHAELVVSDALEHHYSAYLCFLELYSNAVDLTEPSHNKVKETEKDQGKGKGKSKDKAKARPQSESLYLDGEAETLAAIAVLKKLEECGLDVS